MRFTYVGPHDAVDLVGVGTVAHGKTIDVTGPVAASLHAQSDWKRTADSKPRNTRKKPAAGKSGPTAEKTEE